MSAERAPLLVDSPPLGYGATMLLLLPLLQLLLLSARGTRGETSRSVGTDGLCLPVTG